MVGSNTVPDIFEGRVVVSGQMTVLLQDAIFRDYFVNESEISVTVALTANGLATSDFIVVNLPRVKVGSADKDDGEKGISQTMAFTALLNVAGGVGLPTEATTISVQDSQA